MAYLKPQSPIKLGEDHIYPLTTVDQIIMDDGNRFSGVGVYLGKPEESEDTTLEVGVNADTLGGILASEYVKQNELDNDINDLREYVETDYALKSEIPTTAAEVSALASSYGSIIDVLNLRWNGQTSVNICANCDNPMYNGFYHCNNNTAGTRPSTHGELLHITENIVWSEHQLFFPSGGGIHHRHRNNNGTANSAAWSSWKQIV